MQLGCSTPRFHGTLQYQKGNSSSPYFSLFFTLHIGNLVYLCVLILSCHQFLIIFLRTTGFRSIAFYYKAVFHHLFTKNCFMMSMKAGQGQFSITCNKIGVVYHYYREDNSIFLHDLLGKQNLPSYFLSQIDGCGCRICLICTIVHVLMITVFWDLS